MVRAAVDGSGGQCTTLTSVYPKNKNSATGVALFFYVWFNVELFIQVILERIHKAQVKRLA